MLFFRAQQIFAVAGFGMLQNFVAEVGVTDDFFEVFTYDATGTYVLASICQLQSA